VRVDPWAPVPLPVLDRVQETADTVTLTLDASAHPIAFAPGQFTMLYAFGHGEVPISISGDPAHPERLVHTIRGVGKVTDPLVAATPGTTLAVRGPYGRGWPVEEAEGNDVVVVAGGIGLAPVRPLILQLLAQRRRYTRVLVLVGARSPADLLFTEELHRWRGRFDLDVQVTVDRADEDGQGPVGVVTKLLERATFDPEHARIYTCGPEVMMRFVVQAALRRGVAPGHIWLSMERNMKCGIGLCGHCQWGSDFLCKTGPVFSWDAIGPRFAVEHL
jgi:NAD(P)H-flavin reductase